MIYSTRNRPLPSILFKEVCDAQKYMCMVERWWNTYFPSLCVHGITNASYTIVMYNDHVIYGTNGQKWKFDDVNRNLQLYNEWKSRWSTIIGPPNILSQCTDLAKTMNLPYSKENRLLCCPCLRDCCFLDCILYCCNAKSCTKCF